MKFIQVWMLTLALSTSAFCQDMRTYIIYNDQGEKVDFSTMVEDLNGSSVILFGELHNNPICHWLQLELCEALIEGDKGVVLGGEMFETDDQVVLDEYMRGEIKLSHLKSEAKVWPNFDTDYLPIIELAKENDIRFIATNVPRRYASLVSRKGMASLDSLSESARAFLPSDSFFVLEADSGYVAMRKMMGLHGGSMSVDYMVQAQALKDFTMAKNILQNMHKKGLFLHFNGSFHSQQRSGIYNYLKAGNPKLKVKVIASVEDRNLKLNDQWKNYGDYIIVVRSNMTKTH